MLITDETNALAARREAMDFHTRHGVKSVNEIKAHTLTWAELNSLEKDVRKTAHDVLTRAGNGGQDAMGAAEPALDAFTDILSEIRSEKDERTLIGNREPRAQDEKSTQLAKRPQYDAATSHGGLSIFGCAYLGTGVGRFA